MAKLLFAVMSTFGFLLLSERGVIALSGFMLSARLKIFLHAFHLCERCLWLRSITGGAHSFCRFTFLPYETRGPALFDLRWLYGSFSLACEASCAPLPSAPPYWGGTWYSDHHDILAHDKDMIVILFLEAFWTS